MIVDPLLLESPLDKIVMRDYLLEGSVGILDKEKITKQPLLFNVSAYVTRAERSPKSIKDVLDYRRIKEIIDQAVLRGHHDLQEELAEEIAKEILNLEPVQVVSLRVEKPQAITEASAVGVEIVRRKK